MKKYKNVIADTKAFVHEGKKIRFVMESSGRPIIIHADKSKLSEVLFNILRNVVSLRALRKMKGKEKSP